VEDAMQHRREEILAKKAKLAELKRQRELRQNQSHTARSSSGGTTEVGLRYLLHRCAQSTDSYPT
jgi:hypothetical protein